MPCCCATYVKAAFVLGIVLAILSLVGVADGSHGTSGRIVAVISAMIHCVLIFGAHTRNSKVILVWMVLAILSCIGLAIIAILGIIGIAGIAHAGERH